MSVLAMFSNNLFQAKHQENRMEAYYLSYSGALMAFSAITQDSNELLNEITNNKRIYKQEEIELGQGTIDIQARKYNDLPYEGWVEITSVSSLNNGKISTTNILYVDPDNQNNIKWKSF